MIYVCDIVDEAGDLYCAYVDAHDWDHAERIALGRGWKILGRLVECPADVEAMIEKAVTKPVMH